MNRKKLALNKKALKKNGIWANHKKRVFLDAFPGVHGGTWGELSKR